MANTIEVTVSHRFAASAERVYDAWLSPDKVRVWLTTALKNMGISGDVRKVEIDPAIGGKFLFTDIRDGVESRNWGTYLELEPPHKLVFTWMSDESEESDHSKVVVTIQRDGEGCVVTIIHEMDAKWADYESQAASGWSCMMQGMDSLLETE